MKRFGSKLGGFLLVFLALAAASPAWAEDPATPAQLLLTGFTAIAPGQSARLTVINVSGEDGHSSEPLFVELAIYDAEGAVLERLQPADPCLPGQSYNVLWIGPDSGNTPRYIRAEIKVRPAAESWSFQSVFVKGSLETIDTDGTTRIWYQPAPFLPALSILFPPRPVYPLLPGLVYVSPGQSLVYTLFPPEPADVSCLPTVTWVDARGNPVSSTQPPTPIVPATPLDSTKSRTPLFFSFTPATPGQYRPIVSFAACSNTPASLSFIPSEMLLDDSTGKVSTQWPMAPCFPPSPLFQ
ncbi:MAG: hypothetical protein P4L55_05295 [Syntrophobacteraceae bacterium]|nr:hypothetical protein [Syntrophobacteraceae bacterium]